MTILKRHSLELLLVLAKTDFKLRYHGSVLGYMWALLKPLFIFLILNFVFSFIFAGDVEHYSLRLLTGIMMWMFFAEGTMTGLQSLLGKSHLLTKIRVSKLALVLASTVNVLITYLLNLVILAVFYAFAGVFPSITGLLLFGLYSLAAYVLIVCFSLLFAPLFVRFRDLNQIWEVLLTGGFYAAPILYPLSIFPEKIQSILYLNPMTFLISHSGHVLLGGDFSRGDHHLIYFAALLVFFLFSLFIFRRLCLRLVEQL